MKPRPTDSEFEQLKARMRSMWIAGDFGQIARYMAKEAEAFVDRLGITSDMKLLDVACGTGNVAVPAARTGAQVTGVDIAPNLLAQARQRATAEGLQIAFEEGDVEELHYPEAHFDVVTSMFGAMFAPQPDVTASELARVCRHGGRIAMANWTSESFIGKMFRLATQYVPPPIGVPAPVLWGDEGVVRQRLGANGVRVETARRVVLFEFPFSPREAVQLFLDFFGPTRTVFSTLDATCQTDFSEEMEKLWSEHNEAQDGKTVIQNEYLEVVGTRL